MSHGFCSASRAAVWVAILAGVGGACGGPAMAEPSNQDPGYVLAGPALARLLRASDQTATCDETPEQAGARRARLLEFVTRTPMCYARDSSPQQLAVIMDQMQLLPASLVIGGGGPLDRYFSAGTVWNGNGSTAGTGQAAQTNLTFSFPMDGLLWGSQNTPNELNARFAARFTAANTDRGREYIRQSFASWRKFSGLRYNEVADDNASYASGGGHSTARGDVRIGSVPVDGLSGILAYNQFPPNSDMVLDANDFGNGTNFNLATNNYRFFRNVVTHEHGHGLGAIHTTPCNETKLMEPFVSVAYDTTQMDDLRFAARNYGDRYAGNNSAGTATNFGNLTTPILKSIVERDLSTNGTSGANNTDEDWFRFTLDSAQPVAITVTPTGGVYPNGQQTGGCNPASPGNISALTAGNLNIELRDSAGTTVLFTANTAAAGVAETLNPGTLAAGTYTVRVFDVGPNNATDQFVQVYDMTIRVAAAKAPPLAIAGVNKRVAANQVCFFMGDINSRINDSGAVLNNASYDWDLNNDGIFETLDQPQPTRTYTANGIVNVTLRVTDSNGMSATDTITVTVVGATPVINSVTPGTGTVGATVPVTITGISLGGVTASNQVTVSGTGVTVTGTPVVSGGGTVVNGLSFVVGVGAPVGPRNVNVTNADGTGQNASLANGFSVINTPPANDTCSAPIPWGSVTGPRPFSNINATTGTPQSFPSTGCPAAGPINNDTWYSWTAPSNGNLNITTDSATAGTPTPFSSRVAVYNTTTCPPTGLQGCDDFGSAFNVFAQGGRTYLFQVGSTVSNFVGNANVILTFTPILGACCDSSGNCTLQSSDACIGGSIWQGSGTDCVTFPCDPPFGTCCMPDGMCTETDAAGCVGGAFAPGGTCTPNPCSQPTGSCCAADGACVVTEQIDCDGGRTWTTGQVCSPNPCTQPSGACCIAGACTSTTQAACTGSWQGAGSTCSPNPCAPADGACCNAGACSVTTMAACTGTFQGTGTTCSPNPCPQPQGACCNGTACSVTTQAACTGLYQGNGTACGAPGNPTTCCPANFNAVGGVTVQDIFDYLAAYFAGLPSADFNSIGGVTVQDIFDYLAAYFSGCP